MTPVAVDRQNMQEPVRTPILPVRAIAAAKNVEEEHHTNTSWPEPKLRDGYRSSGRAYSLVAFPLHSPAVHTRGVA